MVDKQEGLIVQLLIVQHRLTTRLMVVVVVVTILAPSPAVQVDRVVEPLCLVGLPLAPYLAVVVLLVRVVMEAPMLGGLALAVRVVEEQARREEILILPVMEGLA